MTDSADPGRDNSNEAIQKRMQKYESKKMSERTEISELPRWVKTALVYKELYGQSYNDSAKMVNRAGSTLSNYAKSPAAQKWREQIREFAEDPIEVAKAYLKGNALNISLDRIAFLDMAKQAGDYAAADKIAADLQDRIGITKKRDKDDAGGSTFILQLPAGASFEPMQIEASHEKIEEEDPDYEIVDE